MKTYCATPGADIQYTRDHFSEHITLAVEGFAPAVVWMADRLDGKPVRRGCSTSDQGTMALNPDTWPAFVNLVGNNLAALVGQQLGRNPVHP